MKGWKIKETIGISISNPRECFKMEGPPDQMKELYDEVRRSEMDEVKIGSIYNHFKGREYIVVGLATHTETMGTLVLYRNYHDANDITWARPIEMFTESITREDYCGSRFAYVGPSIKED